MFNSATVDGLQERTKVLVFRLWARVREWHWALVSLDQEWIILASSVSGARPQGEPCVNFSYPPLGIPSLLHSPAAANSWLIPREALWCGASIHAGPGMGHREGEAGEQDCVLISATDSLWLQAKDLVDICLFLLMRFMAIKTLQNLWTHWFINNFLCLLGNNFLCLFRW